MKTQVNVENHVFVPDIDPNEIGDDGEVYVEDYVSRLTMLPLDKSRPLWDMHILNVKTFDAEAVCVIRSHHSLGDGTSLMSLLIACTQKTSHHDKVPTMKRPKTVQGHDKGSWFLRSVLAICSSSVRLIWNSFVDLLLLLATALYLKDTKTPLKGDVDVESNQKKFCHRIVSLDDIKLIKEVMNMVCAFWVAFLKLINNYSSFRFLFNLRQLVFVARLLMMFYSELHKPLSRVI